MPIIKRVTIIAAPPPVFVGTRLTVIASEGHMTFKIVSARKVADRPCIRVDWNDGIVAEIAGDISNLEHTYEKEGVYEIEIGDDIASFTLTGSLPPASSVMLVRVFSNAPSLTVLEYACFKSCANLVEIDLADSGVLEIPAAGFASCSSLRSLVGLPRGLTGFGTSTFMQCSALETLGEIPSGVKCLKTANFRLCTSLTGRLDFPHIETLDYPNAASAPFVGCTGITEIHFAESHMESIQASIGWQKSQNLGAANATVFFDL